MQTNKEHLEIIAKIVEWSINNEIELNIFGYKEAGLKDQISLNFSKNGKSELVRFFDWTDLTRKQIQSLIMDRALNLCLTRLEL